MDVSWHGQRQGRGGIRAHSGDEAGIVSSLIKNGGREAKFRGSGRLKSLLNGFDRFSSRFTQCLHLLTLSIIL